MQPTPPPPTPNPVNKGDHDGNGDSHTDGTQTYETDYYGWLQQQIDLIRQEKVDLAEQETQLIKGFPKGCPFSLESILDPKFMIVTEE